MKDANFRHCPFPIHNIRITVRPFVERIVHFQLSTVRYWQLTLALCIEALLQYTERNAPKVLAFFSPHCFLSTASSSSLFLNCCMKVNMCMEHVVGQSF